MLYKYLIFLFIFLFTHTFLFALVKPALAIGISPPEFIIGTISNNGMYSGTINLLRNGNVEPNGNINVFISTHGTGTMYFFGSPTTVIPSGQNSVAYSFTIMPDFKTTGSFELLVSFLSAPSQSTDDALSVSVVTGATASMRFTVSAPEGASLSSGGGGGGYSSSPDTKTKDATTQLLTSPPSTTESIAPIDSPSTTPTDLELGIPTLTSSKKIAGSNGGNVSSKKSTTPVLIPLVISQHQSSESSSQQILPPPIQPEVVLPKLILTSSTHPNEDVYFSNEIINLLWADSFEISSKAYYKFVLNQNRTVSFEDLTQITVYPQASFKLADGEYFFHVAQQSETGKSEISTRRVLVDSTNPKNLHVSIALRQNIGWKTNNQLFISAVDETSGINYYQLFSPLLKNSTEKNVIPLPKFKFGSYPLTIRVVDKAGNMTNDEYIITIRSKYHSEGLWNQLIAMFTRVSSLAYLK